MTTWGPGWGPTNQIRCALETRDRRPGSSSSIAVSPSLSSPRDIRGQAPFISVWDLDHCHVTFTTHKGIFSQICKSTNMKLWVNKSPPVPRQTSNLTNRLLDKYLEDGTSHKKNCFSILFCHFCAILISLQGSIVWILECGF